MLRGISTAAYGLFARHVMVSPWMLDDMDRYKQINCLIICFTQVSPLSKTLQDCFTPSGLDCPSCPSTPRQQGNPPPSPTQRQWHLDTPTTARSDSTTTPPAPSTSPEDGSIDSIVSSAEPFPGTHRQRYSWAWWPWCASCVPECSTPSPAWEEAGKSITR